MGKNYKKKGFFFLNYNLKIFKQETKHTYMYYMKLNSMLIILQRRIYMSVISKILIPTTNAILFVHL